MSTKKNSRAVIVGLFILVGLVLLVAVVLTLGGQKKTFAKSINVKAIFDDVSGLQPGNNIWLAGVKIGTVKSIEFDSNAKVVVTLGILSSTRQYLHKDAKAKIGSESLIGNKIIVLTEGTKQAPLIQPGDILGIQTTINTEEMMNTLQDNNKNLLAITSDLKLISQQLVSGKGSLGKLLQDETLINTLQTSAGSLRGATANAQKFSADLSGYTAKLQSKGSLANDLVTDTVIFSRLRNTVSQLQLVSESAKNFVNQLEKAGSGLNNSSSPVGVLLNDQQAAADLKATLSNLQLGTQKLDENMEALQHNFLLRGFFKKKAKIKAKADN